MGYVDMYIPVGIHNEPHHMMIIQELFGDKPLIDITNGLNNEIDYVLLKLKVPLGDIAYSTIRESQKPSLELIRLLYERRSDNGLIDGFREYALGSHGLIHLLVPSAKEEATRKGAANKGTGICHANGVC